ncbi:MAG: hormogonium polysaccharide secretion pseudopilin HpsB [Cyanobacteriota bacterium]|nr:hormogonium polysaccharide secretion pseudopilin HpsB [Cyanobacteriota bacterium]
MKTNPNFLLFLLRSKSDDGFTIIEGLLAIIIVTILIMAIGPVLAFAAATRINARRVELASQAARGYVDAVKSGTITAPEVTKTDPEDVLAPKPTAFTCTIDPNKPESYYCAKTGGYSLYCADFTNNNQCSDKKEDRKDFIVQAFGFNNSQNADDGYQLGIRVYRADAFGSVSKLEKSEQNQKKLAGTLAGGLGNQQYPLVEMTTEIAGEDTTFEKLKDRL